MFEPSAPCVEGTSKSSLNNVLGARERWLQEDYPRKKDVDQSGRDAVSEGGSLVDCLLSEVIPVTKGEKKVVILTPTGIGGRYT